MEQETTHAPSPEQPSMVEIKPPGFARRIRDIILPILIITAPVSIPLGVIAGGWYFRNSFVLEVGKSVAVIAAVGLVVVVNIIIFNSQSK